MCCYSWWLYVRRIMWFVMLLTNVSVCLWLTFRFCICTCVLKSSNRNVVWIFSGNKGWILLWNMHWEMRLFLWVGITALKLKLSVLLYCSSRFRSFTVFSNFILILRVNCGYSINSVFLLRTCSWLILFVRCLRKCSFENHVDNW